MKFKSSLRRFLSVALLGGSFGFVSCITGILTYEAWREKHYRIDCQVVSTIVPAVRDVVLTWHTDRGQMNVVRISEANMEPKLRVSSFGHLTPVGHGMGGLPQTFELQFTDVSGKRYECFAKSALPRHFGGTIILVLKRGDNGKDYEMGMYVDKFNRKVLWKRFSWNDLSIKRTLQSPQDHSRFNVNFQ